MLFKKEKSKLKKIFPKNAVIEHIGSTAIPNLGGKGVIDLYVTVKNKEIKNTKKKLISNNYCFIQSKNKKDGRRLMFEKDYKSKGKIRRVHIHLSKHNSLNFKRCLFFRDYLINNKKYDHRKRFG